MSLEDIDHYQTSAREWERDRDRDRRPCFDYVWTPQIAVAVTATMNKKNQNYVNEECERSCDCKTSPKVA